MTLETKLLITPKEQTLFDKLIGLSKLRPDNAVNPLITEYYDLQGHYKVGDDVILAYMTEKYTKSAYGEQTPNFVKWFISSVHYIPPRSWSERDVYQHQLGQMPLDYHHQAQENKCKRFQHACGDRFP